MVVALTSPCRRFGVLKLQDLASADKKGMTEGQGTVVVATVMAMVAIMGDVVVPATIMDLVATMGGVAEIAEVVEVTEGVDADRAVNHMYARCSVHT